MRILLLGAEGAGAALCAIASRRNYFDAVVVADPDVCRAENAILAADDRFSAVGFEPSRAEDVAALVRDRRITHVMNLADPDAVMPIFEGAFAGGADYLDVAMSRSQPHPSSPYDKCGVKLGDDQFAHDGAWIDAGRLAVVGLGSAPGLTDVLARFAADQLFGRIDELSARCVGAVPPSRAIADCLVPPVVWESDRGWFTTEPFRDVEAFDFPAGIGPVDCVGAEHDEVLLMPRWVEARRVTFLQGVGHDAVSTWRRSPELVPELVDLDGAADASCVGVLVTGSAKDRQPRSTYLYHAVDDAWTLQEYGLRGADWHRAVNVAIALELLATGIWVGDGVMGPEAFDPVPYLDLLTELGAPWQLREQ